MTGPGEGDRRRSSRRKMVLRGIVVYTARGTEIERHMGCVVMDMGDDSAKLKPETHGVLPNRFELRLQTGEIYACTVVRRSGYLIGVTLTPGG
jgi:hypothetical protein